MKKTISLAVLLLVTLSAGGRTLDPELLAEAEKSKAGFLGRLEKLVNLDSPTGYGPGLRAVAELMARELSALGGEVRFVAGATPPGGTAASHLVAKFAGRGSRRFLFLAHMDTVFEAGTAARRPFRIEGPRAVGPGVADEKSSLSLFVEFLAILKRRDLDRYKEITLVLNSDEEIGSPGSKTLIMEEAKRHDYVFCLETGRPGDGVVVWRKGNGTFELDVRGKAAHAGVEPEKGRNAVLELAHQMLRLSAIPERIPQLNLTFSTLQGGDRVNVVPERARAVADLRFLYPADVDHLRREAEALTQTILVPDTHVTFRIDARKPPFAQNEATDQIGTRLAGIYRDELGRRLKLEGSGGGSDANYAAAAGAVAIDGLGVVGGETHTEQEYIELESIAPRLYLLVRITQELGG